jgi:hypothetical protein
LCAFAAVSGAVRPSATWSAYLGGAQSSQFTPLDQINLSNVSRLEVAWSFPAGQRSFMFGPLMAAGLVFVLAGADDLVALGAATGAVWSRIRAPSAPAASTTGAAPMAAIGVCSTSPADSSRRWMRAGGDCRRSAKGQVDLRAGLPPRGDRSTGSPRCVAPPACSRTS